MKMPTTITTPQNARVGVISARKSRALKMMVQSAAVLLSVVPMAEPIRSTALYQER